MIREILTFGAAIYGAIALSQAVISPPVQAETLVFMAILLVFAGILRIRDEHPVKRVEMVLLWCAVMFFVIYAFLILGGMFP